MCAVLAKPEFRIRNRSIPDVWRIKTSTRKPHGHPAEKPEALIRAVLAALDLPPGSRIVDPFLGSGTVAAAARAAGLACTGIEAEDRWCQAAARRLTTQAHAATGVNCSHEPGPPGVNQAGEWRTAIRNH